MAPKKKSTPKIKYISPDMLWDAPSKPKTEGKTPYAPSANMDTSIPPRASYAEEYARKHREYLERKEVRKRIVEQQEKADREELHRIKVNACPFCGAQRSEEHEKQDGCPVFNKLREDYRKSVRPLRPGVPLLWAKKYHHDKGEPLPLPEDMYE